jgi:hypothetical protein
MLFYETFTLAKLEQPTELKCLRNTSNGELRYSRCDKPMDSAAIYIFIYFS